MSVTIIAEIGVNHDGAVWKAAKLIAAAKDAGADAVKFQLFDPDRLDPPGERRDMLARLALSRSEIMKLGEAAKLKGLEFLCTAFDEESLQFLVDLKVNRLKIASGFLDNAPFLEAARRARLPILLSTGMGNFRDIGKALEHLKGSDVTLVHCTSAYPCPDIDVNLRAMVNLRRQFGRRVGFSDHTPHILAAAVAAALGAQVVEKHLTLDPNAPGPDHAASLEPALFEGMVRMIGQVKTLLGDPDKRIQDSESAALAVAAERKRWRERRSV